MFDLLIAGGRIYDGRGGAPFRADVGIRQDQIAAIGNLDSCETAERFDASGMAVTPGWIDVHTHSDWQLIRKPDRKEALCQGITTEIVGACGIGLFPLKDSDYAPVMAGIYGSCPDVYGSCSDYLDALPETGTNAAVHLAHSPLRCAPCGFRDEKLPVKKAQELARRGYREIVVTGIEIASWGADLPGKPEVTELIEAVCNAVPALRVRLGSLEPRIVTEDFCRRLSRLPNLCPQFHLSMQSGCDTVLQRMRRKYDTARYYESVCLLRTWFPGCAVTTDMIVAFPGETEEEFAKSLAFIRKCGFAEMHIFPYSRRPGTPADKMPGQHGNAVKEARSRAAIAVAEEMSRAYREALVGSVQSVLFESVEDGLFTGHTPNYVKVYAAGENLHNEIRDVTIKSVFQDGVLGEICAAKEVSGHEA